MKKGQFLMVFVFVFLAAILFGGCTKNAKETTAEKIELLKAQAELEVKRGQAAKNRAALVEAQTESLKVVGNILEIKSRAELLKAQAESHRYSEERSTYIIGTAFIVLIAVAIAVAISLAKSSKKNQKLQDNLNAMVSLAAPCYPQIPKAALNLLLGDQANSNDRKGQPKALLSTTATGLEEANKLKKTLPIDFEDNDN